MRALVEHKHSICGELTFRTNFPLYSQLVKFIGPQLQTMNRYLIFRCQFRQQGQPFSSDIVVYVESSNVALLCSRFQVVQTQEI